MATARYRSLGFRLFLGLFAAALTVWIASRPVAAPPPTLSYQGYLTNPGGTAVNGPVSITFRIYNVASGGVALWTETQPSVSVTNGVFQVTLGSVTPIALLFDAPYFLGVTVGADAEMTPRSALASAAYSFRAAQADTASNATSSGKLGVLTSADVLRQRLSAPRGNVFRNPNPPKGVVTAATSITTGADGLPVIAVSTGAELRLLRCDTLDCAAPSMTTLHSGSAVGNVHVGIGADDAPVVAFTDGGNARFARCGNMACSSGNSSTNIPGGVPVGIGIAADGLPVVGLDTVDFVRCLDASCTSTAVVQGPASARGTKSATAMAMGARGPFFAWEQGETSSRVIGALHCRGLSDCSTSGTYAGGQSPGLPGTASAATSIALVIPPNGRPIIATVHGSGGTQALLVTQCENDSCAKAVSYGEDIFGATVFAGATSWFRVQFEPGNHFPSQVSLTAGADSLPLLAITTVDHLATLTGVAIVKCGAPTCTLPNSNALTWSRLVSGNLGAYASVALGADNMPILSYRSAAGTLEFAKCGSEICTPYFTRR